MGWFYTSDNLENEKQMGWFHASDNLENEKQRWVGSMHRII